MNVNDALGTVKTVVKLIGLCLAIVALAKLAGVQIPMRASLMEIAAVAIACALSG